MLRSLTTGGGTGNALMGVTALAVLLVGVMSVGLVTITVLVILPGAANPPSTV